ncbi:MULTISPECIES: protein-L-isoaspartate O-methyltransferase family protein [Azospira]|jgi:protein-L-isoaspartate(D-aspartate) O-methyltransferase|uniref:Protein-L-isoaspartate O-methyltransferase n=2 Tax=Azospira oryzae TaxID=146939 RepID=G8QP22_AZOOP|nr:MULTISPECIES: protein-L-isoaspartate O-methyltransferase [Azospira]TLS19859.1 MAG: protein-L-isoaspartate O-methyltransferase [Betaproteobacteria bacterium]AEV24821.1 protein-L-isoaspartate carboxylmethyltransferase [Azospira oryzae PS]MBP7488777.1 protein-L-isoaspartate O-methyltransferase [Azospira sp.]MDK9691928.1 protein-L-isoaspartate O-methyltransferase [Azospira sp.]RZT76840.1 protein-L-isoaspartate(D-aspartate) O-methyltransferase [Azospira oryzae]|eukprot:TRINITY_DN23110_c0_g1_i1.p2 TRINITY_DN23110_c0_g1~~TRINITY_DN23110_c0_g1_i1.p2  ORF type:complete len:222 (+),score=1.97 TRINITY_DN23110_c0_g1_i1:258-923(+)
MEQVQNMEQARFNMIEQQIRPWNVLDQDVLDLLSEVRREEFVPAAHQALAFADLEIPLGEGAVMLAPKMEAKLLQELAVQPKDKVLEIGTGSGYMAALLAAKADQVTSVEISPAIAKTAKANLAKAGISNVSVEVGDGVHGWAAGAPYDVIVVSGSLPVVPEELLQQLKVGGRMAVFVGEAPVMEAQIVTRTGETTFASLNLFETVVAPLQNAPAKERFRF